MKYFAYASNMHPDQIKERAPGAAFVTRARLPNHTLVFPRHSEHWQGGVANFVPAAGQNVWGVVYELTQQDKEGLDQYEGVRQGAYDWVPVEVVPVASHGDIQPVASHGDIQPVASHGDIQPVASHGDIQKDTGQALKVMTYKATTRGQYQPSQKYVTHVLEGVRHWGLPPECEAWWRQRLTLPS